MVFTRPIWLLLLLFLPLIWWAAWPRGEAGRRRRALALAMRSVILLGLTLALSGFAWKHPADRLDVVFVLDWSDSIPEKAKAAEIAYVQRALEAKNPDDRAAVLVFGSEALVEHALSTEGTFGDITSEPSPQGSDLEEALRLALALLPPENARRIVVLTDGAYTGDNPQNIAILIRNSGVDLRFVCSPFDEVSDPQQCRTPLGGQTDAAVTAVHLPDTVHRGEAMKMEIVIQSRGTVTGTLEVRAQDGSLLYAQPYTARSGSDHLTIPLLAEGEDGMRTFHVEFFPAAPDFYPQNNKLDAATRLLGEPRLLVVAPPEGEALPSGREPRPDEAAALVAALQSTALQVERVLPQGMPFSPEDLSAYAAVTLVDVPATQLTLRQMNALQRYVRDLGGGLLAIGGPTAFGMGGYFHTPLEESLPLEMQIKDERRRPRLALGYVIDHSGSMMETSGQGGPTKLQLAQEAAIRSVSMLMPGDQVGVVAFDDKASWVVPMQTLDDPATVETAIAHIGGGGGTDIFAGLFAMSKVLPEADAQVRHIILLTDGGADPTGIPELVKRLYQEEGVTLTAIGVGADATPALRQWAELGGGRYHFVRDPSTLPALFTTETALVSRAYLVEETFTPIQRAASPLVPPEGLPPLRGYVAAEAKQTAQVILQSPKEDPILAVWRYGLGKALAFTSDASGRWAQDWLRWEGYAPFWQTAVRAVVGRVQSEGLHTEIRLEGENARLTVLLPEDSEPEAGSAARVRVNILPPEGGDAEEITLVQSGPQRFEGLFHPTESGAYLLHVEAERPGSETLASTIAWVHGYSPEYRPQAAADRFARLLAALEPPFGDGLLLRTPQASFRHDLPATTRRIPAAMFLLGMAAVLLPLEVGVRRLVIGREDLVRWKAAIGRRIRSPKRQSPPEGSRVRTLLRVKRTPKKRQPLEGGPPPAPPPKAVPPPKPPAPPEKQPPPGEHPAAPFSRKTASRLLEHKRSRRGKEK